MAVRRLAEEQPESFSFTPENEAWVRAKMAEYPEGRQMSAVIPVLWRAQEQSGGWLPEPAIRLVADMLDMPYIRVFEVATFYTMFNLQPVGRVAHVQVCGTTPCMLRGAEDIIAVCRRRIAVEPFALSLDGAFSWEEVECAGACVNAPMVQVGRATYEDLTVEDFERVLDGYAAGAPPAPGPQSGRRSSEPITGPTTLTSLEKGRRGEAPGGEAAPPDTLPDTDVPPTHPATREQAAGRPVPRDRAEVEQARTPAGEAPEEAGRAVADFAAGVSAEGTSTDGAKAPAPSASPPDAPRSVGEDLTPAEAAHATGGERATPGAAATDAVEAAREAGALDEAALARADAAGERPAALVGDVIRDDLQAITGIGPKIASVLGTLGVVRHEQIAAWSEANAAWIDAYLGFPGRVARDGWIEQARRLAGAGEGDG